MWQRLTSQLTKHTWDRFVITHGPRSGRFLQSWEWGEFQKAVGETVERWVWEEEDKGESERGGLKGLAQVMEKKISGFGSYAYCPRGPIMMNEFVQAMIDLSQQNPAFVFWRVDVPIIVVPSTQGFHKTIDLQPAMTRMTDLTMTPETLFASLHHKTRYHIRLADRHGIHTRFDLRDLSEVWPLFERTSSRGEFRLHDKSYYEQMLASLDTSVCRAFLASAWCEDTPVAATIMIDFGDVRTYVHGASSYEHRSLMAPHFLHWKLIKDAQQSGLTSYDWWGVSPKQESNHPWVGVSRFKRSFPGEEIVYPGTYDLVKRSAWYTLYRLARCLRRAI